MKKETLVSLFITFLMISSVLGFVAVQQSDGGITSKIKYNDRIFNVENGMYLTDIQGEQIRFYYHPQNMENEEFPYIEDIKSAQNLYFTYNESDPNVETVNIMYYDLSSSIFSTDNIYISLAVLNPGGSIEQMTCQDATSDSLVIKVETMNESSVDLVDNCLKISISDVADAAYYRDLILYKYYGII